MFSGRFSGVTPVFAARSTCHVGGRPVTSNHFSLPLLPVSAVPLHAPLHTRGCALRRRTQDFRSRAVSLRLAINPSREETRPSVRVKYLNSVHPLLVGPGTTCRDERKHELTSNELWRQNNNGRAGIAFWAQVRFNVKVFGQCPGLAYERRENSLIGGCAGRSRDRS